MATWLNEYKELKGGIAQQANGGQMALEQLMLHQELLYRIEVLEACQTLWQNSAHYNRSAGYVRALQARGRLHLLHG